MRFNLRVLIPVLITLGLFVAACGGGQPGVRVGIDASNPPFEYRDEDDQLLGFDIALMEAIASKGGFEIEWVDLTWGEFSGALTTGELDLAVAGATLPVQVSEGLTVSTEVISDVVASVDFSPPFFVAEERFYRTNPAVNVERIGYQSGTLVFTSDEKVPSALEFQGYATLEDAFRALRNGAVDAVHAPEHQVAYHLADASAYPSVSAKHVKYHIAIGKGTGLSETISVTLQSLIDNGTYATLYAEWFDGGVPYAYRPLAERDGAVVQQAQELLEMGQAVSGGILECLRSSDSTGCLNDIGAATVEQVGAMEVEPQLRPLHGALIVVGQACADSTASNIDQLVAAVNDYQDIAGRIAATFVR